MIGSGRRPRRLLRWLLAAALLTIAVAFAPSVFAPYVASRLSAAAGVPVRVGWMSWNPFAGRIVLHHLSVALAPATPPVVTVREIAADFAMRRLVAGDVVVRALLVRDPWVDLRRTAAGDFNLAALLRPPAASPTPPAGPAQPSDAALPPPDAERSIVIDRLRIAGGSVEFQDATTTPALTTSLYLDDVAADDLAIVLSRRARVRLRLASRLEQKPLALEVDYAATGDDSTLRLVLATEGVPLARSILYLPLGWRRASGTLDLHLTYLREVRGGELRSHTLTGDAVAHDVAFAEPQTDEETVRAGRARIGKIAVDFVRRRTELGDVEVEGFTAFVVRDDGGLRVPFTQRGGDTADSAWTTVISAVTLGAGEVVLRGVVPGAEPELRATVRRGAVATEADGGVRLALQTHTAAGDVDFEAHLGAAAPRLRLTLRDMALAELAARLRLPLQFATGTVSGTLDIDVGGDRPRFSGTLEVPGGRTVPPDAASPEEVLAWKDLTLVVAEATLDPLRLRLDRVESDWPYAMVHRGRAGIFPLSVIGPADAATPAVSPGANGGSATPVVEIRQLTLRHGRVEFYDTTLAPPYWTELTATEVATTALTLAPFSAERVALRGDVDAIAPLQASGTIGSSRSQIDVTVERLRLVPLSAYLEPLLRYAIKSGSARIVSNVVIEGTRLEAANDLVLSRFGLARTGDDPLQREVGAPLSVALALMKDARGDIHVELPIRGDLGEGRWEVGNVLATAVTQALAGALRAPVTLLGAVFGGGTDEEERFDLEPIPFAAGSAAIGTDAEVRITELARLLRRHTELNAVLIPAPSAADATALGGDPSTPPLDRLAALADARLHAVVDRLVGAEQIARARVGYVAWTPEALAPPASPPESEAVAGVDVQLRGQ